MRVQRTFGEQKRHVIEPHGCIQLFFNVKDDHHPPAVIHIINLRIKKPEWKHWKFKK